MNPSFNLIDRPWIPCILRSGAVVELSLQETLVRAEEVRELGGESPMVTASLYRLLLALLHRIHDGPNDEDEWYRLWTAGWDREAMSTYFDRWYERFDLFHPERPFYQSADERMTPKSVSAMIHDAATGNNATLFDHHMDEVTPVLTSAQAARLLLAAQNFGLAGPCNPKLKLYFTGGPCLGGILFLVLGESLQQTLVLNMLEYPTNRSVMPHQKEDKPAWEMENPLEPEREIPLGYLDYLTWQNRRIQLFPTQSADRIVVQEMTMSPGLSLENSILNPMMHYFEDSDRGPRPLSFSEEKALWRDSSALFRLRSDNHRPPRVLIWLADLVMDDYIEPHQQRRLQALGMVNDRAKMEFFRNERMPLPQEYLVRSELVESLDTALNMAEQASSKLWGASRRLAQTILAPNDEKEVRREDWLPIVNAWGVGRVYWSQLETPFRTVLETLPQSREEALEAWQELLHRAAWSAFNGVADNLGTTPRILKAVVNAQGQLAAGLAKALPNS